LIPEFAVRCGFDDFTQALVIAGDTGIRRVGAWGGSLRMIFAKRHDREAREFSFLFGFVQVVDPEIDEVHIASLCQIGAPPAAVGRGHTLGSFAVILKSDPTAPAKIPKITRRRILHLL